MLQPSLSLAAILLACGMIVSVFAAGLIAWSLTHPPRMTDGKALAILKRLTPADLGLPFECVDFKIPDPTRPGHALKIAAWWIPARVASDRTAVLLHGFADAKVGSIAWAPILQDLGYHVLAMDSRAHGESGGTMATAGHFERHDTSAVIDRLRAERPAETRRVILFGISVGSAIAVHTAAMRDDIDALIAESFIGDFVFASHAQARLLGLPGGVVTSLGVRIASWVTGADLRRDTALAALPCVKCPVLLIVGEDDLFTSPETLAAAKNLGNVTIWQPTSVGHLRAMSATSAEYISQIDRFLNKA